MKYGEAITELLHTLKNEDYQPEAKLKQIWGSNYFIKQKPVKQPDHLLPLEHIPISERMQRPLNHNFNNELWNEDLNE